MIINKLFNNNGVAAWLWQRISAVVIAAYLLVVTLYAFPYMLTSATLPYEVWQSLFTGYMRLFGMVTIFFLLFHAWIGMCIVAADYIKPLFIRKLFLTGLAIYLVGMFIWFILITS